MCQAFPLFENGFESPLLNTANDKLREKGKHQDTERNGNVKHVPRCPPAGRFDHLDVIEGTEEDLVSQRIGTIQPIVPRSFYFQYADTRKANFAAFAKVRKRVRSGGLAQFRKQNCG